MAKEQDQDAQKALYKALKEFQAESPVINKNKEVTAGKYSYKYADLAHIVDVVRPLLNKHGLAFSQMPTTMQGEPALKTVLMHEHGGSIYDVMKLPGTGGTAQQVGSAISYARRYALSALLGIVTDDDIDAQDQKPVKDSTKRTLWDTVKRKYAEENDGIVPTNAAILEHIQELTGKPAINLTEDDAQALISMLK